MKKTLFWSFLSLGTEFLTGFLALAFISRMYSENEVGSWVLFISMVFITTKTREGMVQNAMVKFSSEINTPKTQVYLSSFIISLLVESFFIVLSLLFYWFYQNTPMGTLSAFYGIFSLSQFVFRFSNQLFTAELNTDRTAINNVLLLILLILSLLGFSLLALDFRFLVLAYSIPFLIIGSFNLFISHRLVSWFNKNIQLMPDQTFIDYMKNGFYRELIGTLSSRAYVFLSGLTGGLQGSAFVGVASRYANMIYLPNTAYHNVMYPKACKSLKSDDLKSVETFYTRVLQYEFIAFIPFTLLLLISLHWLIPVIHGEIFTQSFPYLTILIIHGAFIAPFGHTFGSIMHVIEKPEVVTKQVGFMSIFTLVNSLIAASFWGVWGSVLAPVLSDIIGLILIQHHMKQAGLNGFFPGLFKNKIQIKSFFSLSVN